MAARRNILESMFEEVFQEQWVLETCVLETLVVFVKEVLMETYEHAFAARYA